MENKANLSVCTFNCRSVKNSLDEVQELLNSFDIVMLQEHWLLPTELCMLSELHSDFVATAHSAVDISHGILIGRPYGGTAILFGKALLGSILFIETHESRLSAVVLATNIGPVAQY